MQFLIGDPFADVIPETTVLSSPGPIQMYCCDGSGLHGTGDWSFPPAGAVDVLGPLRKTLLKTVVSLNMPQRLVAHSALESEKPLLEDAEIELVRSVVSNFCSGLGQSGCTSVAPGQPFTLDLLESLRRLGGFCDPTLVCSLRDGVSTGVLSPLIPSGRWPRSNLSPCLGPSLEWCDGNWKSASTDEPALRRLVEQEVHDGFVAEFHGTLADAQKLWPSGVAKGKLGIARSAGHTDRLILGTTISGVNPMAIVPEKTMVPGPFDVRHHVQPNPDKRRVALVIDVSKAHKRIKLARADQGLMLFEAANRLYHYLVCHFGDTISELWWKRVAVLITYIAHSLLWTQHGGHVYVDDWLLVMLVRLAHPPSLLGHCYLCSAGCTPQLGKCASGGSLVGWA